MWLNCKVIKKWQHPHLYINHPISDLSSKNIDTPKPKMTQFLKSSTPCFKKGVTNYGGRVNFSQKEGDVGKIVEEGC